MSEDLETKEDRNGQEMGAFQYKRHLYRMGVGFVTTKETPIEDNLSWDFDVNVNGLPTIALEVRCISYTSHQVETEKRFELGLIIDNTKINKLTKLFSSINPVTKVREWDKHVILLIRCKDEVCYTISMERIRKHRDEMPLADPSKMRHDHGKEINEDKVGYHIPLYLMEKFI